MGEPDKNVCNCDQALAAEAEVRRLGAMLAELFAAVMEAERPGGRYARTQRLVRALAAVRDGS